MRLLIARIFIAIIFVNGVLCEKIYSCDFKQDTCKANILYNTAIKFYESKNDDSALYLFKLAGKYDDDSSSISGLCDVYIGELLLRKGKRSEAIKYFLNSLTVNKNKKSAFLANSILDTLKYEIPENVKYFPNWVNISYPNITFHFQDTTGWPVNAIDSFMKQREEAYVKLTKLFNSSLPYKVSMYVWNDKQIAEHALEHIMGFADPGLCIINATKDQSIGHELTHVLSYWSSGTKPIEITRFINEGVAVAFDMKGSTTYAHINALSKSYTIKSVIHIWDNSTTIDQQLFYSISGAFVKYLYHHSSLDQFKSLIKNQTIESAISIYGANRFQELISGFDRSIGFQ